MARQAIQIHESPVIYDQLKLISEHTGTHSSFNLKESPNPIIVIKTTEVN